jgi:hypothetical protein
MADSPNNGFKLRHSNLISRTPSPKQKISQRFAPQIRLLRQQIKQAQRVKRSASNAARGQIDQTLMRTKTKIRTLQNQMDSQLMQLTPAQENKKSGNTSLPKETKVNTEKAQ